jgi:putative acetyltransferase
MDTVICRGTLALRIRLDDLQDRRIAAFMEEHLEDMHATSPPESVHALDLQRLRQSDIQFWTAWLTDIAAPAPGRLVGTGALKSLSRTHAELKAMRTAAAVRGQGVARAMLEHILGKAVDAGCERISLETGTQPFFEPARRLYQRYGFEECAPFGSYRPDPYSCFMTRTL